MRKFVVGLLLSSLVLITIECVGQSGAVTHKAVLVTQTRPAVCF